MNKIYYLIIFLSLAFVSLKHALHMFQQNRYEFYRYTKWLFNKKNIHLSSYLIFLLIIFIIRFFLKKNILICNIILLLLCILMAIYLIYEEINKEYIKDLVITNRVKRQIIYFILLFLGIEYLLLIKYEYLLFIPIIFALYGPYLLIYPMAILTFPLEYIIKKRYENEAKDILNKRQDLIKIAITGSYGKTSTKNIINDIIGEEYYSLMTPLSYNTPMGITKVIREELKPIHETFICEMGADHVGDITYLMDFIKPKYGILSAIGPQHLNTFKSITNIIKEKFEIIEKLPEDGIGIINIDNEYIKDYHIQNNCQIITIGIDNKDALYVAENINYTKDGTSFDIEIDNKKIKIKTPLLGKHNIYNVLLAIALAKSLNIPNTKILNGIKKIKQIEHRLELKKINNYTFIDNAFNSNPVSSKLSLDVLKDMDGKRIIVTPGLIDLGQKEDLYNYEFGTYMLNKVDFVILVGEKQTSYIYKGLKDNGFDLENILIVKNVKEAFDYIYKHFAYDDIILLENDLPDAFNI